MRIVFMGTPDFSVPCLQRLAEDGHELELVITRPDKPRGRSRKPRPSPVKEAARALEIPVLQPENPNEPETIKDIAKARPDIIMVIAFGEILGKEILELPELGCVNAHASLLPRHRGAAPVQWAILQGDIVTGVTTMMMDHGMDTGDILLQRETEISEQDTGGTLHDKLAALSADLVAETLHGLEQGTIEPSPQDHDRATYARELKKEDGRIDFHEDADTIARKVRAFDPWPGAYAFIKGEQTRIMSARPEPRSSSPPGKVLSADRRGIVVACKTGSIRMLTLKPPGKKGMDAGAYLAGRGLSPGDRIE
ncbi:MAG: methionyl-tRNA formyltransferase [bacterium]